MCFRGDFFRYRIKHSRSTFFPGCCLFSVVILSLGCTSSIQQQHIANDYLEEAPRLAQNFQYRKALLYYQKAWEVYKTVDDPQKRFKILYNMGNCEQNLQDYEQALKHYRESLKFSPQTEDRIKTWNNLGLTYRYLGQYTEALKYFDDALAICPNNDFFPQLNKAVTLIKLAQPQPALEILEHLFTFQENPAYRYEIALTQAIRGILEASDFPNSQKNLPKALADHQHALKVFKELQQESDLAFTYHNIGRLYAEQKNYQEALKYYSDALALSAKIGDRETAWLAYYNLGNVYKEQSDFDKALENYKQSIDIIESIRSKLKIDDFKTSFIEDKVDVYKALINLLLEMGEAEEAFNYLERAKSRALVDLLSNQRIQTREGIDERLIKKKERADDNIRILSGKLDEENSKPEKKRKEVVHLTENLRQARQDYQRLLHEIQLNNPEYASLVSVNPPKLMEIQNWIPDHTAFLEYLVLEDKILIFILTRDELHVVEDKEVTQKELQGTVLAFRIDIEREMSDWREKSQWLYSKLIAPMEKHLDSIDTLCIIPYGILHYLPFGALLNKSNNQFLLEQPYDLFYAPSATMLKFAFNKRDKRPLALPNQNNTHNLLLIFANPDGNLDFAEDEAKEIQKLYPQKTLLLKESDATEGKVKDLVGNYCLIHFATHGILDPVQPLFSSLVFADGFLEVHEIFNEIVLNNSSLVTLSACNTALGRRTEGDEIIGLTRAFIYAGAPSIMASLWAVDDQSTALIMQRFYEYLKENKYNNKAKALKEAQKSLLKHPKFHHPYYWAAFELFGDYR